MAYPRSVRAEKTYQDLIQNPQSFEFLATVKLLRHLLKPTPHQLLHDKILICSNVEQRLHGPEVQSLSRENNRVRLMLNSFGLDVLNGPLPQDYTQRVIQNLIYQDKSLYEFLTIFNNRLSHLLYAVHRKFKVGLNDQFSDQSPYGQFLKSVIGIFGNAYPYEKTVPLRSQMIYARLYWCRSGDGLCKVLRDFFRVPIEAQSALGRWNVIPEDIRTQIGGRRARHNRLGQSASLGSRFWDQDDKMRIVVGAVSFDRFKSFLKTGSQYPMLCDLVHFYKQRQSNFTIKVILQKDQVPATRLGGKTQLGWTSWLKKPETDLPENSSIEMSSLALFKPEDLGQHFAQTGELEG